MGINRLHHVGMSVPDLDAAKEFYCGVLGFEEAAGGGFDDIPMVDAILGLPHATAKTTFLRRDKFWIEMFEFASPTPRPKGQSEPVCNHGISHFCLDVTDLDALYAECVAKGMRFHTAPVSVAGVKTTYGRDPFGNVIELQEILDEDAASQNWRFRMA